MDSTADRDGTDPGGGTTPGGPARTGLLDLAEGAWLNPPPTCSVGPRSLTASAARGSDLWRDTYYGFTRDTGHALLVDLPSGSAIEVSVAADPRTQFDQAGILVRRDETRWVKAGVELVDGTVCVGAVVTAGRSDWSSQPVARWRPDEPFDLRVSRDRDALVLRVRMAGDPWRLLRVCPFPGEGPVTAGPYLCAPGSAEFSARFHDLRRTDADPALH